MENEIHERQGEQRLHLGKGPVVSNRAERSWILWSLEVRPNRAMFASGDAALSTGGTRTVDKVVKK